MKKAHRERIGERLGRVTPLLDDTLWQAIYQAVARSGHPRAVRVQLVADLQRLLTVDVLELLEAAAPQRPPEEADA